MLKWFWKFFLRFWQVYERVACDFMSNNLCSLLFGVDVFKYLQRENPREAISYFLAVYLI